jgi:purine-binding chemotaxis protein CheW
MTDPAQVRAARPERSGPVALRRFLTFRVDGRRYALPAEDVSEIIHVPPAARLPHSPKSLMGLANLRGSNLGGTNLAGRDLRGTVVPLVDPRIMLRREPFAPGSSARAIVLAGNTPVALAVDAVDTLVSLEADQVETRRPELAAEPGEILLGAFQLGAFQTNAEQPVTKILDLPAMLAAAFRDRPAPAPNARAIVTPTTTEAEPAANVERRMLLSFEVASQDYALPLDIVREITLLPASISIVPRTEAVLVGVAAWRDGLLPLLSLRGLLGFPPADAWTGSEKVLVAMVNGALVGLVADRARALIRADVTSIDPAPAMLAARGGGESTVAAIFRGDGGRRLVSILAPEQLFREDVMRRIGGSVAPPTPAASVPAASATVQFVVFRLGDEEFALPIHSVDEVARLPEQMTRVPKMPKFLEGVINLRGEVLPVVDQRRRFDMPEFTGTGQRLIVVRSDRHRAGLIVDSVSEVLRTDAAAIDAPPDLTGEGPRLVSGVINVLPAGRMILLLDPAELLTRAEQGVLDELDLPGSPEDGPDGL